MKREWKGSKSGKNDNEKKLKRVGKKDIGLNKIREMKRIYYKEIWNHTSELNEIEENNKRQWNRLSNINCENKLWKINEWYGKG